MKGIFFAQQVGGKLAAQLFKLRDEIKKGWAAKPEGIDRLVQRGDRRIVPGNGVNGRPLACVEEGLFKPDFKERLNPDTITGNR